MEVDKKGEVAMKSFSPLRDVPVEFNSKGFSNNVQDQSPLRSFRRQERDMPAIMTDII